MNTNYRTAKGSGVPALMLLLIFALIMLTSCGDNKESYGSCNPPNWVEIPEGDMPADRLVLIDTCGRVMIVETIVMTAIDPERPRDTTIYHPCECIDDSDGHPVNPPNGEHVTAAPRPGHTLIDSLLSVSDLLDSTRVAVLKVDPVYPPVVLTTVSNPN